MKKKRVEIASLLLLALLFSCPHVEGQGLQLIAEEVFSGKVVAVMSGDTISVMRNEETVRIRLEGIDAPERGQPFFEEARLFASTLLLTRTVTVRIGSYDRSRPHVGIARVSLNDIDVSHRLLKAGMAWLCRPCPKEPFLEQAEREARREKRGLWSEPEPVPPWKYRGVEECHELGRNSTDE